MQKKIIARTHQLDSDIHTHTHNGTDFSTRQLKRSADMRDEYFSVKCQRTASQPTIDRRLSCRASDELLQRITGSAVALHSCKAHSKSIGKMKNSTPCKIVTPEDFILKLGIRDYVENITHYTNFHVHRFSGGFSTNR